MQEVDLAQQAQERAPQGLSIVNRLRYYGSVLGVTGLTALAAAGCGESSSGGSADTPQGQGNTPGETGNMPQAQQNGGNAPENQNSASEPAPEEADTKFPLDSMVTVHTYDEGDLDMTFEEMQEFCEGERQEEIQKAEGAGLEILVGPKVTLSYSAESDPPSGTAPHEYTCEG